MITISDFEDDGITEEGLKSIKSGIMYKSFADALTEKYNELNPTNISDTVVEGSKKPVKRVVNGAVLIFNPDGSVYDLNGHQIK
jgi:hypothetical protein